ncbi:ABC transporter permease, partial [Streptococcus agalactiae]|nr:ABC transporter permease [Streptococcus agalactiae]
FDADNEKVANETVEVEIKGLFDGHNSGGVSAAQELYENTLITDVHSAAKVYGNTEDTAVYQDATFFVKGDKNLDSVIKDLGKLDINWREYNLIKSSSNYPALQQSISGIYSI